MTDTKKNLAAIRTPLTKAQLFASIAVERPGLELEDRGDRRLTYVRSVICR